jgi:hypothetical protein
VELFCLVPAAASANWDAAFTVKGIKLEALVAEATWWQLEVDKVWGVPLIHVASDLELAASHAYMALKIKLAVIEQRDAGDTAAPKSS